MWRSDPVDREDLYQTNQLGNELKDAIFKKQLMDALKEQQDAALAAEQKTYAEKVNRNEYTVKSKPLVNFKRAFTVEGDNKTKSKTWDSMMSDACFYYDNPTVADELKMKKKLQYRYDSLFDTTMRPPLQSRKDLVLWTCAAQNQWMEAKEKPELAMDCTNYKGLLSKYGPDYTAIKQKLGHLRGLVTDDL